ncbi:MAG: hypothetical protein GX639_02770 [Fibrobacter sp.]|nr:hypothetical protein [Fibrobacter sp.]
MAGKHCRLYDENLVHNIMISTGMSVLEYIRENKYANTDDICEFVEFNARTIIEDTIEQLNTGDDAPPKKEPGNGGHEPEQDSDDWQYNQDDPDYK